MLTHGIDVDVIYSLGTVLQGHISSSDTAVASKLSFIAMPGIHHCNRGKMNTKYDFASALNQLSIHGIEKENIWKCQNNKWVSYLMNDVEISSSVMLDTLSKRFKKKPSPRWHEQKSSKKACNTNNRTLVRC